MVYKSKMNWAIGILLSIVTMESVAQDTIRIENFENYEAGAALSAQASAEWFTWNNGPATSEDPMVSDIIASSGNQSLMISGTNDVVFDLDKKTFGRYEISFNCTTIGWK
jgi:hypothetical protein